jgi:hypothetical protein
MVMGTSVRLVTFQFMSMALHLNVKRLVCYVLMCFWNLFLLEAFLLLIIIITAVGAGKKSLCVIQSSTAI